jgi:hypothetical protein
MKNTYPDTVTVIIQFTSVLCLFTCLLSSPKVNYKVCTNIERKSHTEYKQGNLYHLDNNNSISAITPTIKR